MTNRKIKDKHKNDLAISMFKEAYRNILRILLILHYLYPKQFYPKILGDWLDKYPELCSKMDRYEKAGIYKEKIAEYSAAYGIDRQKCFEFVLKNNPSNLHRDNKKLLADNVCLVLVHTCEDFGLGEKRLEIVMKAMLTSDIPEPEKEIEKLGIKVELDDINDFDYRTLKPKKQKELTYKEIKAAYKDLEGLKAYQEYMRNSGDANV